MAGCWVLGAIGGTKLCTPWLMIGPTEEDNEGVGYVAKEPGAQIIKDITHIKKSNRGMTEERKYLLLWIGGRQIFPETSIETSLVTGQKIRSRFIESFKPHQMKGSKNFHVIREGDDAAHLGSGANVS